jgi:epoxyqueuosine reductase QueG
MSLEREVEEFLLERGALKVGFANAKSLSGGPPSADLTYILPEARSAVSFALPLDRDKIRAYLSKESHTAHERDNYDTNVKSSRLAKALALFLEEKGYPSKRVISNNVYRTEVDGWELSMPPDISHRYVAARSGVGSFSWSGNIGLKGYGSAVILGTCVTSAELEPTDPESPEESFCDECKMCVAACPSGMFDAKAETTVTLGGITFSFSERRSYLPCQLVCGGFTGLDPSGEWSTWSPGRYPIPDDMSEMMAVFEKAVANYARWPERTDSSDTYVNMALSDVSLHLTCGNCQIVCWGDREQTRENMRLLKSSGCVIQRESGDIDVLPSKEAAQVLDDMPEAHKKLYTL